jgi:N6-L-threonylcarbamoyladenine synthase
MSKIKILAIETSCDDTSVAIVTEDFEVLSNLISSQDIHELYGGVVPELASRMHIKHIMPLTTEALKRAQLTFADINAVAVAVNPGLIGSLLVGVAFAKGLAYSLNIPLIAVNHMIGHIYANKITHPELTPPYLTLVVSGGHTELVHFVTDKDFCTVGKTLDDAAGEAFDKVAKLLGLGYPGGPIIDSLATKGNPDFVDFPRALNKKDNYNFSYSGLKTAVRTYLADKDAAFIESHQSDLAASAQKAIVGQLVEKTINYAHKNRIQRVLLAGGVAANSQLRKDILAKAGKKGITIYYPPLRYCMDNAAMIAAAAIGKFKRQDFADIDLNPSSTKGVRNI